MVFAPEADLQQVRSTILACAQTFGFPDPASPVTTTRRPTAVWSCSTPQVSFTGMSTPTIDDVVFLGNHVTGNGGALSIVAAGTGPIVIRDASFGTVARPNRATDFGGAVYVSAMAGASNEK